MFGILVYHPHFSVEGIFQRRFLYKLPFFILRFDINYFALCLIFQIIKGPIKKICICITPSFYCFVYYICEKNELFFFYLCWYYVYLYTVKLNSVVSRKEKCFWNEMKFCPYIINKHIFILKIKKFSSNLYNTLLTFLLLLSVILNINASSSTIFYQLKVNHTLLLIIYIF